MTRRIIEFVADTDAFTDDFPIFDDNGAGRKTTLGYGLFSLFYRVFKKLFVHVCILESLAEPCKKTPVSPIADDNFYEFFLRPYIYM